MPADHEYSSDADLAAACGRGEEEAFLQLERGYREMIYRTAYRFLGDREEALDVAQDALLVAFRQLHRWVPRSRLSTWLYRIAANLAVERHRARARRRDAEKKSAELAPTESVLEQAPPAQAERVRVVISQLPEQQRKVVTLRFIEGLQLDEVAEALEITRNNAKTALARGMRRLRQMLVPEQ